jgi:peptide/nickel transport system substrate-binding protein
LGAQVGRGSAQRELSRGKSLRLRRSLLRALLVGVVVLQACSSAGSGSSSAGGSSGTSSNSGASNVVASSTTAAPPAGGVKDLPPPQGSESSIDTNATLRIAARYVAPTLDPHKAIAIVNTLYLYDALFQTDKDKNIVAGLATSYAFSDDKKSLTLTLRDNATFSDGTPVDADAVKQSLDRARSLPDSTVKGDLAGITAVTVLDPHNVRIDMSEPDVGLVYVLATHAGEIINPKALAAGTDLSKVAAGSTPYDIVQYDPGKTLVLERRPNASYWDPAAWKIKRIEITLVTDPNTVINGLRTGAFDVADTVLPPDQVKAQVGPEFNYTVLPSSFTTGIMLRDTRPVLQSESVRQAIAYAIDRKTIADNAVVLCPYNNQIVTKGSPGYIDGYDPYPYDPAKAKSLLAGATPQIEMLVAATQANENKIAPIAQQELSDVGFKVTITSLTLNEANSQFQSGSRDAIVAGPSISADTGATFRKNYIGSYALAGPDLKPALLTKLNAADALPLGSTQRNDALKDVNKTALDWATFIPICQVDKLIVAKKNVLGVDATETAFAAYISARYFAVPK